MSQRVLTQQALADLAAVPAASRWVRSGNLRLHVLDYGGEGAALLMVPGITSPAISMDFVARELTDLVRPLVLDVRGRGLSDEGSAYSLVDYVADIQAVITGLELDRPVLLGHSMGARIAAAAALRMPLRGSVVVDPPMSGPCRGAYPTALGVFRAQLRQAQRGTDADEVADSWPRWPRREQELRARWLASCDERAIVDTHRGFESEDFFDYWPTVPAPTVLIHGANSQVVTAADAEQAAAANPAARLIKIPAAGHMVFWDNPPVATRAVREILPTMVG